MPTNTISLSRRAFTDEDMNKLRSICDENKLGYGIFSAIVVKDVLSNEELTRKYVTLAHQFEDDQMPASIADMKALRAQLRQQEEELEALRKFKEQAKGSLNDTTYENAYRH